MTDDHKYTDKFLEADLSHRLVGVLYEVANKYGAGFKEKIYEKALAEELERSGIDFETQKHINIFSIETGKVLGTYVPDFVVADKIILELKASKFTTKQDINQQRSYLKAGPYEIAYLVNFGTPQLYLKRSIFTNDRKPFLAKLRQAKRGV